MAVLGAVGAMLAARYASAQDYNYQTTTTTTTEPAAPLPPPPEQQPQRYEAPLVKAAPEGAWAPKTGFGIGFVAGGGVGDYTKNAVKQNTDMQGVWNLRTVIGTRSYAAIEGAWTGAAGTISGFGLDRNNTLIRNGLEAALRLNAPFNAKGTLLEPYIFGGVGWDRYQLSHSPNVTADVTERDNALVTPVGVGFNASYRGFLMDIRYAFRPTFREDLLVSLPNHDLTNWTASGQLGYEF
jgi:hypothetical protein